MTAGGHALSAEPASILVVDDDKRVVELLTIALNAYGFRVLQATDGEEALHLASRERPDLIVLDVRLPKRSGYEVCELLRQDPEDPQVPIIMVSAAAETEARLQGLSRGADDYVAKPFSPKELIARIRRLLTRSNESREARRRSREAEHELGQAREEAKRSHAELRDQVRLRELTETFVRDFHGSLDAESLTRRLLIETQAHLGAGMVVLLAPDPLTGSLRPSAFRGETPERARALHVEGGGELAALLSGLGRPIRRRDLDRFPELRSELQPFVSAGIAVFAPLRGPDGLVGIVVADERLDGGDIEGPQLETVGILCHTASLALRNASRATLQAESLLEALEALASQEADAESRAARAESAALVSTCMEGLPVPLRQDVAHAVRVGDWVATPAGAQALETLVARDGSGRLARFARVIDLARDGEAIGAGLADADLEAAFTLVRFGLAYLAGRIRSLSPEAALEAAFANPSLAHPVLEPLRAPSSVAKIVTSSQSR